MTVKSDAVVANYIAGKTTSSLTSAAVAFNATGTIINEGNILSTFGSCADMYKGTIKVNGAGNLYSSNNGSCIRIMTDADTTNNKRKVYLDTTGYCYARGRLCVDYPSDGSAAMYGLSVTKGHFLGNGSVSSTQIFLGKSVPSGSISGPTSQSRNFRQIKDYKSYETVALTGNYIYYAIGV